MRHALHCVQSMLAVRYCYYWTRYQCAIAVVKDISVSSRLNWQGISVLSLLSGDQCVIGIELARYQCVIAVVKEISLLSRLN